MKMPRKTLLVFCLILIGFYKGNAQPNGNNCPSPANLSVTNLTQTSAEIHWTDGGSASFDVNYIDQGQSIMKLDITGTSLILTNLNEGTNYVVSVRGRCSGLTSAWIEGVRFTTCAVVDLGDDQTICEGGSSFLDAGTDFTNFQWSNQSTAQQIAVSTAGVYSVIATLPNGCTSSDDITITVNPSPIVDLGEDVTICAGSLHTLTAGNQLQNVFNWSTGETTSSINVTATGTYWVEVKNAFGCTASDEISINANVGQSVSAGNDQSVCEGQNFSIMASPGFTEYHWSTGANTQGINPSMSGTYIVTARDGNGCESSDEVSLTIKPLPVIDLGPNRVLCYGETTNIKAAPGFQSYFWSNGSTSSAIDVNTTGVFSVFVTDANGCVAFDQIQVSGNPQIVIKTESITNAACNGNNVGAASISVSGGVAPYKFDWSNDGLGDMNDPEDVTGLPFGEFSLRVVDSKECAAQKVFSIGLDADKTAPEIKCLENIVTCNPVVHFTTPQAIDNCGVQSVQRVDGKTLLSGSEFPIGNTTITFEAKDHAGNVASCSFVITVLPKPELFVSDNITILPGQATQLTATTSLGSSVLWSPENLVADPTSRAPIVMPEVNTLFTVVVTDSNGCSNMGTVMVSIDKNVLTINNILTPNGDGLNDTWQVNEPSLIKDCEVKIFNRWGKEVYHTGNYKNEWDGTQNGMIAQEGTYYYTIKCRNLSPFTGAVTLVGQSN